MPTPLLEELRAFHRFLSEKVRANAADLSPEEALDEWRRRHPSADTLDEDTAAVQEVLDDLARGAVGTLGAWPGFPARSGGVQFSSLRRFSSLCGIRKMTSTRTPDA